MNFMGSLFAMDIVLGSGRGGLGVAVKLKLPARQRVVFSFPSEFALVRCSIVGLLL